MAFQQALKWRPAGVTRTDGLEDGLKIEPGDPVTFEPGGCHLMPVDLKGSADPRLGGAVGCELGRSFHYFGSANGSFVPSGNGALKVLSSIDTIA